MKTETETENILLVFIIIILAIAIGYWFNTTREGFYDGSNDGSNAGSNAAAVITTIPQTTTSQETLPSTTTQATNHITLSAAISKQISDVSDSKTRDILQTQLTNLQALLNRYATLDTPIVMNDDGQVCSMWGDYDGGRYRQEQNQCVALDNTFVMKCLDAIGTPNTCNNIMADGYINRKSNINYNPILDSAASTVINAIPNITSQIDNMNNIANTIITSLTDRGSIQLQQQDILKNNNENMAYKNKLMNDNTEKLSKTQNETNINQNNFFSFINQITNLDSTANTYLKIIIGLIIAIVIMGILNFLFSNILS